MKLRVARATNDFDQILAFYQKGLGLELLTSFEGHEGFDGLILGLPGEKYHFEFVREEGHVAPRAPSKENLVVFYIPDGKKWEQRVQRMIDHGYLPVPSQNPYWDRLGKTFEDSDGYRVVLFNQEWE